MNGPILDPWIATAAELTPWGLAIALVVWGSTLAANAIVARPETRDDAPPRPHDRPADRP